MDASVLVLTTICGGHSLTAMLESTKFQIFSDIELGVYKTRILLRNVTLVQAPIFIPLQHCSKTIFPD